MENLKFKEEPLENNAELSGRERVPIEEAMAIQSKLREYMTPSELTPYIESDPDLLNGLILRWIDKYAARFKDYCDLNASNEILMHKITNNNLSDEDFSSIKEFLEQPSEDGFGGPFFTPEELAEFIE